MLFQSFSVSSLRLLALTVHFLLTTFLFWTRFDSLQVTLKPRATYHDYNVIDSHYQGIISFGLALLTFEIAFETATAGNVSFFLLMKLVLDLVACFFVAWIALDGLDWKTYIYILVFCVVVPTFGDAIKFALFLNKNIWTDWRKPGPVFQMLFDSYAYLRTSTISMAACFCGMFAAGESAPQTTSLVDRLISCLSLCQEQGVSGACESCWGSCWACMAATPGYLYDSGAACLTMGPTGAWDYAVTWVFEIPGPTAIYEYLSSYCGSSDSSGESLSTQMYNWMVYIWAGLTYAWAGFAAGAVYSWTQFWDFATWAAPLVYSACQSALEGLWAGLSWLWRQVRLFCQ
ncbi:hypothetical protein B484DRAFT_214744 [Ochromonadaceae sp. CCMP2298]|nr:hypothetical protein B484DRAFT_214744 [Ochromonadaceae sp. CCMP2298]|mmetsp:Transcript_23623/g.52482  ORF Transcript_23623/g.52482 Transcript_23623/m.52482 type:complete len:345 (+) Transcript_23623:169-1203(+)